MGGWAFVSVEGKEEQEVTEVMKDWEGADVCLETDILGLYREKRIPSSKKLHFLWRWFKLYFVFSWD